MAISQWDIKASDLQCIKRVRPKAITIQNSAGGQLIGAHKIADYVKQNNIAVNIKGECLSACTIILAAANESTMCKSSSIAVHHFGSNGKATQNHQVLKMHLDAMERFGIDKEHYRKIMISTPYTRFHHFNHHEMAQIGFRTRFSPQCS